MSMEYAERRIKEALKLSNGNTLKARQQLIAWTYEDPKLLHILTKPHLSGIVAYNIERVASGRADAAKEVAPAPKKAPAKKAPQKKKKEQFGLEILKAVADSDAATFGLEDTGAMPKKTSVSQSHIDAIQAMASKSKSSE